jgi:transposase
MISLPSSVRIYLAARPVDMRKGIDGLMGDVRGALKGDPYSGHLFVFVGRRADRVKVLYWDRGGFVLYCKRLECGRFRVPPIGPGTQSVRMDSAELGMLLEGIDFSRVRRPVPWMPNASYRSGMAAGSGEKLDSATDS